MFDLALKAVAQKLNRFMHQRFDLDEDVVVLSAPFDGKGDKASNVNDKLVVFLVNLQKDTVPNGGRVPSVAPQNSTLHTAQPLFLNLYVMVASCFDANRYDQSLRFLSAATECFQQQPVIDHHNMPELDTHLDKLILDIENIGIHELSNLWSILGGSYQPSILYKVRMVMIASDSITKRSQSASQPQTNTGQRL